MERKVGTVSRGLRAPIIKEGEDLSQIVIDTVMDAANSGEFTIQDRDVLAVTESILARSQERPSVLFSQFSAETDLPFAFAVLQRAQRRSF